MEGKHEHCEGKTVQALIPNSRRGSNKHAGKHKFLY